MSQPTTTSPSPLDPRLARASAFAAGDIPSDDDLISVRAAHKDYNARGRCRQHWYRLLWDGASWSYAWHDGRLPRGTYMASERRATTHGDVAVGDLLAEHDRGGKIDTVWLVVGPDDSDDSPLHECDFARRKGELIITLPDGRKIRREDPRR